MLLLFALLLAMGNSLSAIALIFLAWGVIRAGGLIVQFQSRKKYFDRMESMIEEMDPVSYTHLIKKKRKRRLRNFVPDIAVFWMPGKDVYKRQSPWFITMWRQTVLDM